MTYLAVPCLHFSCSRSSPVEGYFCLSIKYASEMVPGSSSFGVLFGSNCVLDVVDELRFGLFKAGQRHILVLLNPVFRLYRTCFLKQHGDNREAVLAVIADNF